MNAFGLARYVGVTKIARQTRARAYVILFSAFSISSTRRWHARCWSFLCYLGNNNITVYEWITSVAALTQAYWRVTHDSTFRIYATRPRARILAFFIYACHGSLTFAVTCTFRTTIWRYSNKFWHAFTVCVIAVFRTQ